MAVQAVHTHGVLHYATVSTWQIELRSSLSGIYQVTGSIATLLVQVGSYGELTITVLKFTLMCEALLGSEVP